MNNAKAGWAAGGAAALLATAAGAWVWLSPREAPPSPELKASRSAEVVAATPEKTGDLLIEAPAAAESAPSAEKAPEKPKAAEEKPAAQAPERPAPDPWTFRVVARPRDLRDNPVLLGEIEMVALDMTGQPIASAKLTADEEVEMVVPGWPAALAVGGKSSDLMVVRGQLDMPFAPPAPDLPWKSAGEISFDDENRGFGPGGPGGPGGFGGGGNRGPAGDNNQNAGGRRAGFGGGGRGGPGGGDNQAGGRRGGFGGFGRGNRGGPGGPGVAGQDAPNRSDASASASNSVETDSNAQTPPAEGASTGTDAPASGESAAASGGEQASGEQASGEPASGESAAASGGEQASGENANNPDEGRERRRRGGGGGGGGFGALFGVGERPAMSVAFSFDTMRHQLAKGRLDALELDMQTDPTSRTVRLEVVTRGVYTGRIEATVENLFTSYNLNEILSDDFEWKDGDLKIEPDPEFAQTTSSLMGEKEAERRGLLEETQSPSEATQAKETSSQQEAIETVRLNRPWEGGGGPWNERARSALDRKEPEPGALPEPGREPRAYRYAQRSTLLEAQPQIAENKIVFDKVPPGQYELSVETTLGRQATSKPFMVKPWETTSVALTLEDAASLAIKVVAKDSDGQKKPVAGAEVEISRQGAPGWARRGMGRDNTEIAYAGAGGRGQATESDPSKTTGEDGVALFKFLEPGPWRVDVEHAAYPEVRETIRVTADSKQTHEIELKNERAKVEVRLVSTEGEDIPDGRVAATRERRFFPGGRPGGRLFGGRGNDEQRRGEIEAETLNGRAEFELDYGVWHFQGLAMGYQASTLSAIEINDPGPIELTLTLPQQLTVTARLTQAGAPLPGRALTFFARAESTFGPNIANTDEQGMATLQLAPGTYAVYANRRYLDSPTVRAGATNHFELTLDGLVVEGYVRDASTNAAIEGARVQMVREIDPSDPSYTVPGVFRDPRGRTDAEGLYRINEVAEGTYKIEIVAEGYASLASEPLLIAAETVSAPLQHELSTNWGSIAGRVSRPDGTAAEGIFPRQLFNGEMTPYPVNYRDSITNQDGRYQIEGLEPGVYIAQFAGMSWRGDNYLPHMSDVFEVKSGETTDYSFVMQPAGSLRVSVRDPEQVAVGDALISLVNVATGESLQESYPESPDPISDVGGEFHWMEIPPAFYRVYVSRAGWRQVDPAPEVEVRPDATLRVTAIMERGE
jgi:hypothetical protein